MYALADDKPIRQTVCHVASTMAPSSETAAAAAAAAAARSAVLRAMKRIPPAPLQMPPPAVDRLPLPPAVLAAFRPGSAERSRGGAIIAAVRRSEPFAAWVGRVLGEIMTRVVSPPTVAGCVAHEAALCARFEITVDASAETLSMPFELLAPEFWFNPRKHHTRDDHEQASVVMRGGRAFVPLDAPRELATRALKGALVRALVSVWRSAEAVAAPPPAWIPRSASEMASGAHAASRVNKILAVLDAGGEIDTEAGPDAGDALVFAWRDARNAAMSAPGAAAKKAGRGAASRSATPAVVPGPDVRSCAVREDLAASAPMCITGMVGGYLYMKHKARLALVSYLWGMGWEEDEARSVFADAMAAGNAKSYKQEMIDRMFDGAWVKLASLDLDDDEVRRTHVSSCNTLKEASLCPSNNTRRPEWQGRCHEVGDDAALCAGGVGNLEDLATHMKLLCSYQCNDRRGAEPIRPEVVDANISSPVAFSTLALANGEAPVYASARRRAALPQPQDCKRRRERDEYDPGCEPDPKRSHA
jgi:hypothetical protein